MSCKFCNQSSSKHPCVNNSTMREKILLLYLWLLLSVRAQQSSQEINEDDINIKIHPSTLDPPFDCKLTTHSYPDASSRVPVLQDCSGICVGDTMVSLTLGHEPELQECLSVGDCRVTNQGIRCESLYPPHQESLRICEFARIANFALGNHSFKLEIYGMVYTAYGMRCTNTQQCDGCFILHMPMSYGGTGNLRLCEYANTATSVYDVEIRTGIEEESKMGEWKPEHFKNYACKHIDELLLYNDCDFACLHDEFCHYYYEGKCHHSAYHIEVQASNLDVLWIESVH